jgi:hypothetical protein
VDTEEEETSDESPSLTVKINCAGRKLRKLKEVIKTLEWRPKMKVNLLFH